MSSSVFEEFQLEFDKWKPQAFCKKSYIGINYKNEFVCQKLDYKSLCTRDQCQWDYWIFKEKNLKPKGLIKFLINKSE